MRIVFFSDNFFPEISGISDSIILLGKELTKRGHEIRYVGPSYTPANYKTANIDINIVLEKEPSISTFRLPAISFPNSPTKQARIALPLGITLRRIRKFKPDIIHTQTPFGAGFEGLIASKILGIPIIGTNHTPIDEFMQYSPVRGGPITALAGRFYSWYYNRCLFTSTPSLDVYKMMLASGFKKEHQKISNPVDLRNFKPISSDKKVELKQKYNVPGLTIIHTGRLAPEKHVDQVMRAFATALQTIPDMHLIITGHGISADTLKKLGEELKMSDRVMFTGYVSEEKLYELYQASDIFTTMSTAETQCLSLMHAMASGLPSIVAHARALAEYTPPEAGFLVKPGDETELAERIVWLAGQPAIRATMGAAAINYVQQFSPEYIAEVWERIYASHMVSQTVK